ncbi:MAG: hypothetical protein LC808_27790, partial [Actinobacteria bacterium]|nr:hypothetical protein [Actinomycetota bacterium]
MERSKSWLLHAAIRNDRWWVAARTDPDLVLLYDWIPAARRRLWSIRSTWQEDGSSHPDLTGAEISQV